MWLLLFPIFFGLPLLFLRIFISHIYVVDAIFAGLFSGIIAWGVSGGNDSQWHPVAYLSIGIGVFIAIMFLGRITRIGFWIIACAASVFYTWAVVDILRANTPLDLIWLIFIGTVGAVIFFGLHVLCFMRYRSESV